MNEHKDKWPKYCCDKHWFDNLREFLVATLLGDAYPHPVCSYCGQDMLPRGPGYSIEWQCRDWCATFAREAQRRQRSDGLQ